MCIDERKIIEAWVYYYENVLAHDRKSGERKADQWNKKISQNSLNI